MEDWEKRNGGNRRRLVEMALTSLEHKLESDEVKGTIGDLIRLVQLEKELEELEEEQPREIRVTWVESSEGESATKK